MTALKNDTLIRALLKQPVEYTPVWLMRQAGRYLPEYKATRAKAGSFLNLCRSTELATEVTLQPLNRFNLDAAILFSDILTIPEAMGLGLYFETGEGPKFQHPLQQESDIAKLTVPDMDKLRYVFDAVAAIRTALNGRVPLIGFSGSPFTLACYMVEGSGSKDWRTLKTMLYARPDLLHRTFSLHYIKQVIGSLKREHNGSRIPVIVFTKGGGQWLELLAESGADAIGLDWTTDIANARARIGSKTALQGNLDPAVLFGTPEAVRTEAARILAGYGHGSGHVFNLGHGISQFADPENVRILIDTVHSESRRYHA